VQPLLCQPPRRDRKSARGQTEKCPHDAEKITELQRLGQERDQPRRGLACLGKRCVTRHEDVGKGDRLLAQPQERRRPVQIGQSAIEESEVRPDRAGNLDRFIAASRLVGLEPLAAKRVDHGKTEGDVVIAHKDSHGSEPTVKSRE
jgi:hypothetical protein